MDMIHVGVLYTKMIVRFVSNLCYAHFLTHLFFDLNYSISLHGFLDTNAALHFYSHDNARTTNGVLNITTERKVNMYKAFDEVKKVFYADKKYIQSGMLQSWNKFCFIGGAVEFSAKLPGDPHKGGLWPACTS